MLPNFEKFVQAQRKLFDNSHKQPHELKQYGYQILKAGLDTSRNYMNPDFMSLPMNDCEHLRALTPEQVSVLTAHFFAQLYIHVMNGEIDVIHHNSKAADLLFSRASDEWTVLLQESSEEHDHVITFRSVSLGLLGNTGVPPVGAGRYGPLFRWLTAYLAAEQHNLSAQAYGALTLSVRFLANLELKRQELYLHADSPDGTLHPAAVAITDGHRTDESRHTATSWEFGTGFFRSCSESDKHLIRGLLAGRLDEMLNRHFSDRAQNEANGNTKCAIYCLDKALQHPAFSSFPVTVDQLRESWRQKSIACHYSDSYKKSIAWFAKQWIRFVDEFQIQPTQVDSSWTHFRRQAA
jgi:hypothetical protein